jgi:hypothetical protein
MTSSDQIDPRFEELTSRESDGIRVSLLWSRDDNGLKVIVADLNANTSFEIEVRDAPPLDVFNHPYAYSAFRSGDATPAFALIAAA